MYDHKPKSLTLTHILGGRPNLFDLFVTWGGENSRSTGFNHFNDFIVCIIYCLLS